MCNIKPKKMYRYYFKFLANIGTIIMYIYYYYYENYHGNALYDYFLN